MLSDLGCLIIPIVMRKDERGSFTELYKKSDLHLPPLPIFKQDNVSYSHAHVVRGLHFQTKKPQGKLVRVLKGHALDIVVDLRPGSNTYGQKEWFLLKPDEQSVYIPPGFAHGFWALEETIFHYKCTEEFDPSCECGLSPLDTAMDYPWRYSKEAVIISKKDAKLPSYADFLRERHKCCA